MPVFLSRPLVHIAAAAALAGISGAASAQFDPARVIVEPAAIAARFPDPAEVFSTPAFAPDRRDFTSHAEMTAFAAKLGQASHRYTIETVGRSQEGRAMLLLVLTGKSGFNPALPTVLLLGQQHGNEPAGGEAALVIAQRLVDVRGDLLERENVLVMPRANPDAAEHFARVSSNGTDVNRDHLLLRTPEAQAVAEAVRRYPPQVMLDMHEFTVAGRWVDKFASFMRYDALLQAANTGNLSPTVQQLQARYLAAARAAIEARGQRVSDYFTTSSDARQKAVSMGGVNIDTGRNVGGLRNAVSILLETRGVGLGRAHLARRVEAHVGAAMGVIELAAREGSELMRLTRDAGMEAAAQACRGEMAVAVKQTPERRTLQFLDATTGEPRDIEVDWRSSLTLQTTVSRPRQRARQLRDESKSAGVPIHPLHLASMEHIPPSPGEKGYTYPASEVRKPPCAKGGCCARGRAGGAGRRAGARFRELHDPCDANGHLALRDPARRPADGPFLGLGGRASNG
jgi:hypothetical protein